MSVVFEFINGASQNHHRRFKSTAFGLLRRIRQMNPVVYIGRDELGQRPSNFNACLPALRLCVDFPTNLQHGLVVT